MPPDPEDVFARYQPGIRGTEFSTALGIENVEVGEGESVLRIKWDEKLAGNPETGVIHGGVITALLDHGAGAAIASLMDSPMTMATLDLRIDYMKPATPGEDVFGHVRCYRKTRNIAFVRGEAHQGDPDDPVATFQASFMLTANRVA